MSAKKHYQVLVSSVSSIRKEESQAVQMAVLELGHMLMRLEAHPASDEAAWSLIGDAIDQVDYLVVVLANKPATLDNDQIDSVEKEYDCAVAKKRPIFVLLERTRGGLPGKKTKAKTIAWKKLQAFRKKVEASQACASWTTATELRATAKLALTVMFKAHPQVGWVRAGQEATDVRADARDLAQGDDEVSVKLDFDLLAKGDALWARKSVPFTPTLNEIFAGLAPRLIDECSGVDLAGGFQAIVERELFESIASEDELKGARVSDVSFSQDDFETILVQLRALGLIEVSKRRRNVKEKGTYWRLTPAGDQLMVKLRALRRPPVT